MKRLQKPKQKKEEIYFYVLGKKIIPGMHNVRTSGGGTKEEQKQAFRELAKILSESNTNLDEEFRKSLYG